MLVLTTVFAISRLAQVSAAGGSVCLPQTGAGTTVLPYLRLALAVMPAAAIWGDECLHQRLDGVSWLEQLGHSGCLLPAQGTGARSDALQEAGRADEGEEAALTRTETLHPQCSHGSRVSAGWAFLWHRPGLLCLPVAQLTVQSGCTE